MERYRSGHNEAVLKTVCPQGRVGSNPTLSARQVAEKKVFEKTKKVLDKQIESAIQCTRFFGEELKNWIKSMRMRKELF